MKPEVGWLSLGDTQDCIIGGFHHGVALALRVPRKGWRSFRIILFFEFLQADRGCARSRLLLNMCSSKEDGTYYNQFSRFFTTLYGMIHHKRGGTLRRGHGLKEQEMTM
jgi:hypothetical protein